MSSGRFDQAYANAPTAETKTVLLGVMTIQNTFLAIPATRLRVTSGANIGDCFDRLDAVTLEDQYQLTSTEPLVQLTVETRGPAAHVMGAKNASVPVGTALQLAGVATLISLNDACVVDAVVIVAKTANTPVAWLVPTSPLSANTDYTLTAVEIGTQPAAAILAQMVSASFVSGTRLMTGARSFVPVEALRTGDTLYTRDNGVQPIRWINKQTVRAAGQFAPVMIAENTFGTHWALSLSPMHRLFAYRRNTGELTGRAEQLVAARNLVNGVTVTQTTGGFVDYFQVVLDNHEMVFAEGIAVESQIPMDIFDEAASAPCNTPEINRIRRQASYAQLITADQPAPIAGKTA